jgi:hypothetical protein
VSHLVTSDEGTLHPPAARAAPFAFLPHTALFFVRSASAPPPTRAREEWRGRARSRGGPATPESGHHLSLKRRCTPDLTAAAVAIFSSAPLWHRGEQRVDMLACGPYLCRRRQCRREEASRLRCASGGPEGGPLALECACREGAREDLMRCSRRGSLLRRGAAVGIGGGGRHGILAPPPGGGRASGSRRRATLRCRDAARPSALSPATRRASGTRADEGAGFGASRAAARPLYLCPPKRRRLARLSERWRAAAGTPMVTGSASEYMRLGQQRCGASARSKLRKPRHGLVCHREAPLLVDVLMEGATPANAAPAADP